MDFLFDPSLVLYLPLYQLDGASFISKDACGHLCTVTGALWRPNGREFDGSDDRIDLPSILTSGDWSFLMWVNSKAQDELANVILHTAGGWNFFYGGTNANYQNKFGAEGSGYWKATTNITLNSWQMVGCAIKASDGYHYFYRNGLADGSVDGAAHYPSDPYIGSRTSDYFFNGKIGEVIVYRRLLSATEFLHYYLRTKWRYQ